MKEVIRYTVLILLLSLVGPAGVCQAITATLDSTGWTEYINTDDLLNGAGSDLTVDYWSVIFNMDITGTLGNWQVDVRRSDIDWNTGITLSTRRVTDGTGSGTITGGTGWQGLQTTDNYFFNGSQDRTGINLRCTVTNISVLLGAHFYTTTIIYTVYDN